jgi:NADH:ubiquinone oxidoreductase subunit H
LAVEMVVVLMVVVVARKAAAQAQLAAGKEVEGRRGRSALAAAPGRRGTQ